MAKGDRLRKEKREAAARQEETEAAVVAQQERDEEPDFLRKLARADSHIDSLDEAIQGWLGSDAYALAYSKTKTCKHFVHAKIKAPPDPDLSLLIGDAVHNLRVALDHIAYGMLLCVYEGEIPTRLQERAEFPVVGYLNREGNPRTDPDGDFNSSVTRNLGSDLPDSAREALRDLQPYQRGTDFARHEVWIIHDLDRVDKHRHLHLTTAAANVSELRLGGTGYFPSVWIGGGEVGDGDKVAEWVEPQGPSPKLDIEFARQVVMGEPEAGADWEPVPLLKQLRGYVDSTVLPALEPFL